MGFEPTTFCMANGSWARSRATREVEIDVGQAADDSDHQIDPDERIRVAMARQ